MLENSVDHYFNGGRSSVGLFLVVSNDGRGEAGRDSPPDRIANRLTLLLRRHTHISETALDFS